MEPQPELARDRAGWFYRAVAPDPDCAVLEVGDAGAGNWFRNVVRAQLNQAGLGDARFDVALLHATLGGCRSLAAALESAHRLLRPGGLLALAGSNRLGLGAATARDAMPRAAGWAYRRALRRAGFAAVTLYTLHPYGNNPIYVISADRRSARPFFHAALLARHLPPTSPSRLVLATLVRLNVTPYLQDGFVVVGRKC